MRECAEPLWYFSLSVYGIIVKSDRNRKNGSKFYKIWS